jgi:bacterioferritin-associated ferredoxin
MLLIYLFSVRAMYVCMCNAVTDGDIRAAVSLGARSLSDLTASLGVASCCGRCADFADNLVNESRRKAETSGGDD